MPLLLQLEVKRAKVRLRWLKLSQMRSLIATTYWFKQEPGPENLSPI
jgi:hypothetical protein